MEEENLNRAERRRREKEAAKSKIKAECNQCDKGPCVIAPKEFDKCPVCGCPVTFTVKAMQEDIHLQSNPALFSFDKIYDTPNGKIKLTTVGASCARCGVFFTIARDKMKGAPLFMPGKGRRDGPGLILPGQGG